MVYIACDKQGTYTLIRDDDLGQSEYALDARLCFSASKWTPEMGGQTEYIARCGRMFLIVRNCDI